MGYAVYRVGPRWGGYAIPAYCEHPDCNEEIDRGMSFACGGEPFSEYGCDRYFCSKHRIYTYFDPDQEDGICRHEDDCECEAREVCERCSKSEQPFPYKQEHPEWVDWFLSHSSWKKYRKQHPEEVKQFKAYQANPYKP